MEEDLLEAKNQLNLQNADFSGDNVDGRPNNVRGLSFLAETELFVCSQREQVSWTQSYYMLGQNSKIIS